MAEKLPLFKKLMRAPRKAYDERPGLHHMPYKDYRALLSALADRPRYPDIKIVWKTKAADADGSIAYTRFLNRPNGPRVDLVVPEMIAMAHEDRAKLYDYLEVCYALLRSRKDETDG